MVFQTLPWILPSTQEFFYNASKTRSRQRQKRRPFSVFPNYLFTLFLLLSVSKVPRQRSLSFPRNYFHSYKVQFSISKGCNGSHQSLHTHVRVSMFDSPLKALRGKGVNYGWHWTHTRLVSRRQLSYFAVQAQRSLLTPAGALVATRVSKGPLARSLSLS